MLTKISDTCFELFVDEDSDNDWKEKQWEQSKPLFDSFYEYLMENKGIKEATAAQKTNMAAFFIMNFLFVYYDFLDNILFVGGDAIRTFLGNWYIRKSFTPRVAEMNKFLRAIDDFYTFIHKQGFMSKESLREIKETCKDKEWFAQRLKSYFESHEDEFEDWLAEYNYDII